MYIASELRRRSGIPPRLRQRAALELRVRAHLLTCVREYQGRPNRVGALPAGPVQESLERHIELAGLPVAADLGRVAEQLALDRVRLVQQPVGVCNSETCRVSERESAAKKSTYRGCSRGREANDMSNP